MTADRQHWALWSLAAPWSLAALLTACGGASGAGNEPGEDFDPARTTGDETHSTPPGAEPQPMPVALSLLVPAGAERVLVPLREAPADPLRYAEAARFYAVTDVGGMTLLWGLTFGAMGGHEEAHAGVAEAMLAVLRERVTMRMEGTVRTVATRLAPGAIPVIVERGSGHAPVAHLFELRVTPALTAWDGGSFELDELITIVRNLAVVGPEPLGLDAHVEMLGYLHTLEVEGHLAAFAAWLFGPALPDAWASYAGTHGDSVETMRRYLESHPFRPRVAIMPDDLVAFP